MHASPDPWRAFARGVPWVTGIVALAALVASLPSLAPALQLERGGGSLDLARRAVTGHLTHVSADHLAWDLAVFVVAGVVCELRSRRQLVTALAASAAAVSAAVLVEGAHLPYRGLSGIDCALVALLASSVARDELARGRSAGLLEPALVLIAIVAKALYETLTGSTLFVDSAASGMVPVPIAHLAGAAAGIAVVLLPAVHRGGVSPIRWQQRRSASPVSYASVRRKEAWPWTFAGKAWW